MAQSDFRIMPIVDSFSLVSGVVWHVWVIGSTLQFRNNYGITSFQHTAQDEISPTELPPSLAVYWLLLFMRFHQLVVPQISPLYSFSNHARR
jgi:hypothetical protein